MSKTQANGSLQLQPLFSVMKSPEYHGEERRGELQVREGSFIESIRIVCSNLFARKLPSVSGTAGRTGGDWWGCQYQHPLMCLHKHSSHWAGLTRPRAKFDQICRNDVMNIMML